MMMIKKLMILQWRRSNDEDGSNDYNDEDDRANCDEEFLVARKQRF